MHSIILPVDFLSFCKCQVYKKLPFLNTAITKFCLIYSLNIPSKYNQNPSFFPVESSV